MHRLYKLTWVVRAIFYKPFFGRFVMPGYMGSPSFLFGLKKINIGRNVGIFPGLRAECHGVGRIIINDNVAIAQGFHITCMGEINIGKGSRITGYVSITDIEHEYISPQYLSAKNNMICKKTEIGENCFIGMGARIQAGTILGNGCVVGANAVVRGVFPDYSMIVGMPGRVIKRFNIASKEWEKC